MTVTAFVPESFVCTWLPPAWDEQSLAWWVWTPNGWRCRTVDGQFLSGTRLGRFSRFSLVTEWRS